CIDAARKVADALPVATLDAVLRAIGSGSDLRADDPHARRNVRRQSATGRRETGSAVRIGDKPAIGREQIDDPLPGVESDDAVDDRVRRRAAERSHALEMAGQCRIAVMAPRGDVRTDAILARSENGPRRRRLETEVKDRVAIDAAR